MRYIAVISVCIIFTCTACTSDEREKKFADKAAELDRREQDLDLRERSLVFKEEELQTKQRQIDSASATIAEDTLVRMHPDLPGLYNVTMKCTQTSCAGSAVGDTKTEQWQITIDKNQVIAKALSNQKVVRIYKGGYLGNTMELVAQTDTIPTLQDGNMRVRLQQLRENHLRGIREITRPDNCRIVYDLELQKQ
jgi:hypothetical protein